MQVETIHIKNPSKKLLLFLRELRENKQRNNAELLAKKDIYFPKSK